MFGMEPGEVVTGKMVGALRMLGFDYVYDTNFAADVIGAVFKFIDNRCIKNNSAADRRGELKHDMQNLRHFPSGTSR